MGVFALRDVPKGTLVTRYLGRPRWAWDLSQEQLDHSLQLDYDLYAVPRRGSAGWYVNHSCEPSCVLRGERSVVTRRDVKRGEEFTFDYSTNVGWERYRMDCRCGARGCRGTVTDYGSLSEAVKRSYGQEVSPFLLRKGVEHYSSRRRAASR